MKIILLIMMFTSLSASMSYLIFGGAEAPEILPDFENYRRDDD